MHLIKSVVYKSSITFWPTFWTRSVYCVIFIYLH